MDNVMYGERQEVRMRGEETLSVRRRDWREDKEIIKGLKGRSSKKCHKTMDEREGGSKEKEGSKETKEGRGEKYKVCL